MSEPRKTILIVDDEPKILLLLEEVLKIEGYRLYSAQESKLAINLAQTVSVDLMLLDISMPKMNGFEIYKILKDSRSLENTPVIFISGRGDVESKLRGFEMGAADYISKPFHPKEVVARVKRQLKVKSYQQNLQQLAKLGHWEILTENTYGKYRILELLGSGGMSSVYKVKHTGLGRPMALKILDIPRDKLAKDSYQRFQEEAHTIAKIRHPNVVEVYDAGFIKGRPYIAMELVNGDDLESLCRNEKLSYGLIHEIIEQAAKGLAAAHAVNVVHRDIKPSNLLLTDEKIVKITDFGIARDMSKKSITEHGVLLGTPAYMSPQQCYGAMVDARSDIYSLGMTLYFLLTGAVPFISDNNLGTILLNLKKPLPDPRLIRSDIPDYLCEILLKMTQKSPDERYQNLEELLSRLRLCS